MCGRYALALSYEALQAHFGVTEHCVFRPRYNIAPGQTILTINQGRRLNFESWGIHFDWKHETIFLHQARIESVLDKKMFRNAFLQNRCLIPATGYFEWKTTSQKKKQPYYGTLKASSIFSIAGIKLESGVVLLTKPSEGADDFMRAPVTLLPEMYARWLNPGAEFDVEWLLSQKHERNFIPVTPAMGRAQFDNESCLQPLV